jgi:hypothetical protein
LWITHKDDLLAKAPTATSHINAPFFADMSKGRLPSIAFIKPTKKRETLDSKKKPGCLIIKAIRLS